MTTDDWPKGLTTRIAEQIRAVRKAAGLTVAELSQACADRGLPIPGTTITNLENGRRHSVDLGEFLVLADALGIPPISLLFPLNAAPIMTVLPGREMSAWEAVTWFTGETPTTEAIPADSPRELLETFRAYSDAVATARVSTSLAKARRRKASTTLDPARRATLLETAAGYDELAFDDCRELRDFRNALRERGLAPPELPAELAFVDAVDSDDAQ
ncbi:helix-turn-helix transcriptional regulator [Streptomyces sp. H10-C2]|uniref:helix-turn-helix domain-containing protein n=1 Tax=unclassified Streptomyces TaxID=2593676 RepID=UPI0024BA69C2|nr:MULTISPECIES: helix-turn-helix transcriptional regulator [unclassified Streptomyces]MDJ0345615.1 helix-turn-helix transcriptional regulator [Streptomyces sp. PH10-H1]MDJ0372980.1 helix-turn-helix transcriptional regulator [Streptomyces sp. H10-C2]